MAGPADMPASIAAAPNALSSIRLFVFNIMGVSCKVFTYD
jgi:hypothetical protein